MGPDRTAHRLAVAITSFERPHMLDAILRDLMPMAESIGVPVVVYDNASADDTPDVLATWARSSPAFRFVRRPEPIPPERNILEALADSRAEYTWWSCDDDYLVPARLAQLRRILEAQDPSAIVVGSTQVADEAAVDFGRPLSGQLRPLLATREPRVRSERHRDAGAFFARRFYDLPGSTVVYRTRTLFECDATKYLETYHAHLGALYEALAQEQVRTGRVEVVELFDTFAVSLTRQRPDGKPNWRPWFRMMAERAFPRFIELLPPLYAPHRAAALEFHRTVFREAFHDTQLGADAQAAPHVKVVDYATTAETTPALTAPAPAEALPAATVVEVAAARATRARAMPVPSHAAPPVLRARRDAWLASLDRRPFDARLADDVRGRRWYHTMDLGGGIVTPGHDFGAVWENVRRVRATIDYDGASVLDLATFDGMWAFEAEALGAGLVVAVDCAEAHRTPEYERIPARDGTARTRQRFMGHENFGLVREALRSEALAYFNVPTTDLVGGLAGVLGSHPLVRDGFDVVQHLGLLYHVRDPMMTLAQARSVLRDGGVLLLETGIYNASEAPAMFFNRGFHELFDDPCTWWLPTLPGLVEMLRTSLFDVDESSIVRVPRCGAETHDRVTLRAVARAPSDSPHERYFLDAGFGHGFAPGLHRRTFPR